MAIDKKIDYKIQGGVKNYRPSEMVSVPKIAKSSPDTPTAKLAYITPEEEKILIDLNLYGSLKGKPNRGPGGIPSLEGDFGSPTGQASTGAGTGGTYSGGGGDYSSAETGNFSGFDGTGGTELPPGVNPTPSKEAQAIRNSFIAAGGGQRVNPGFFDSRNTVSPVELAMAKASNPSAFNKVRGGGITNFITGGGLIGGGIRSLGQMFGLGKQYNQPTYDMSEFSGLGVYNDTTRTPMHDYDFDTTQLGRSRTLTNAGTPTQQGDYDIYGNKINELTGEVIDKVTGEVITVLPGYPGSDDGGITNIPTSSGGSGEYVNLIDQYVPDDPVIPNDAFKSRFLQNRTTEEREAIEAAMTEKFKDFGGFGLGDMDGS
mgnify:FL=1